MPAIKSLTGAGATYFTGSKLARLATAGSDAIGQFGFGYYQTKNVRLSFYQINWSSVTLSGVAPGNKLSTFAINGFISNTYKVELTKGLYFGSSSDIGYGMLFEMFFGKLIGKWGDGAANTIDDVIVDGMNAANKNYKKIMKSADEAFSPELKESLLQSAEGYLKQAESFKKLIWPSKTGAYGVSVAGQGVKNATVNSAANN